MLVFGIRDSAESSAEADSDARGRAIVRPREACVFEREQGAGNRELGVAIEPFQPMRREEGRRVPIADFTRAMCLELARVEARQPRDAALTGANVPPERLTPYTNAGDRTDARDDGAPHRAPLIRNAATMSIRL